MEQAYTAPGTEAYADPAAVPEGQYADASAAGANGWYGDQSGAGASGEAAPAVAAAVPEQQGFSIPTTGQSNGGGPMRQGRGASRFNPMQRKTGGGDVGVPASAASAEKNELGFIIFAYNIGYQTDESQLHALFQPYGNVAKVNVIQDFATGQGKGFGFVTMPDATEAETAVNSLNGSDFNGNTLQIRFKTPKGQNPTRGAGRGTGFRGVGQRGAFGMGGFRGGRGGPRGAAVGGYRGVRGGGMRGGMRGRGRGGAYSSAPSAYDGFGYGQAAAYDQYGVYADPNAAAVAGYGAATTGYEGYPAADPYSGYTGTGFTTYGATGQW